MSKQRIITILILLLIAAGGYFYFKKEKKQTLQWRTAKIERGDLAIQVTATGTLNPVTTVQVGTQVSGSISKIFVDFNSVVKQGEVIAELDKTFLAASVEDADATVNRTEAQCNQAKREYDRNKKLFDEKVVSQADYDVALTNYETAKSNLQSAKAQLNRANINLKYATITAPIGGIVTSRNVDVGQTVAASFSTPTLFVIANDLTKMQVQASINEADIGQIKVGQKISFSVDAYQNQTFSGEIKQIRLQPTVVQNVVNYNVIIDVPNPDMKLLPGMTANIVVNINEQKDILKVPLSAIKFNPPQEYFQEKIVAKKDTQHQKSQGAESVKQKILLPGNIVKIWLKEGNEIKQHAISVGLSDGSFVAADGEIKEGDEVVVGVIEQKQNTPQQSNPFGPPQFGKGKKM